MSQNAPNEIIYRILLSVSYVDIVRARAVCKAWKEVIETSIALQYIVWLGISGESDELITEELELRWNLAAFTNASESNLKAPIAVSERLLRLLEVETSWVRGTFARQTTVSSSKDRAEELRLRGCAMVGKAAQASVIEYDEEVGTMTLPSGKMTSEVTAEANEGASDRQPVKLHALPELPNGEKRTGIQDGARDLLVTMFDETEDFNTSRRFRFRKLSDPRSNHPWASDGIIAYTTGHDDTSSLLYSLHGTWFAIRHYDSTGSHDGGMSLWNWISGEEVESIWMNADCDESFSEPIFVDDDKFIIGYVESSEDATVLFNLYQISEQILQVRSRAKGLKPVLIATFRLPEFREDLYVTATFAAMRTTRVAYELERSDTAPDGLCHISFTTYPGENDIMHTYSFFFHPNAVLRHIRPDAPEAIEVSWDDWGAEHCACFKYEVGAFPMGNTWYIRGDRVVVVEAIEHEGSGIYFHRLRVLDFRPERVRRAAQVAQGEEVWPPAPADLPRREPLRVRLSEGNHEEWGMYAFNEQPIRCELPYIESELMTRLRGSPMAVQADERRIVLNTTIEDHVSIVEILTI